KSPGCKECANRVSRGNYQQNDNYLEEMTKGTGYKWLEEYKGDNKIKLNIKHIKCGHVYKVRPNDFQQGYKCPKCFPPIAKSFDTKNELVIKEILDDLEIPYKEQFSDK